MSVPQTQFHPPGPLTSAFAGKMVIPEHVRFDEARRAWNLAIDQRPAAVVFAESPQDVAAAVLFAREFDLRIAAQGTGHNAGPLGPLEDTILLKTERMRGIEIDPVNRVARVEAGVLWPEVAEAAARHWLAALAGSSPEVGVVGYTLVAGSASVLGSAQRRQLRHRHGDRARAAPRARSVRGDPLVPDRARRGDPAGLPELQGRRTQPIGAPGGIEDPHGRPQPRAHCETPKRRAFAAPKHNQPRPASLANRHLRTSEAGWLTPIAQAARRKSGVGQPFEDAGVVARWPVRRRSTVAVSVPARSMTAP